MNCKIYCYEYGKICDLVFEIKDFGVVSIEQYPVDNEWMKEHWSCLKDYEDSFKCKYIKTYIGTVN